MATAAEAAAEAAEAAVESFQKLMNIRFEVQPKPPLPKPRGSSMSPMQSRAPTTPPATWRMDDRLKDTLQEVEVLKHTLNAIKQRIRPYTGSDGPPYTGSEVPDLTEELPEEQPPEEPPEYWATRAWTQEEMNEWNKKEEVREWNKKEEVREWNRRNWEEIQHTDWEDKTWPVYKEGTYWEEKKWTVDKDLPVDKWQWQGPADKETVEEWPVDKWEESHQEQWQGPADKETVEEWPVDQEGPPWSACETDQDHTVSVKTAAPWCQDQHNTDQYQTCHKAVELDRAFQHRQAAMDHARAAEWHAAQAAESSNLEPATEAWLRNDVLTVDEWNYWKEGLQVGNTLCWQFVDFKIKKIWGYPPGCQLVDIPMQGWAQEGGGASGSGGGGGGGAPPPKRQRQQRGGAHLAWYNAKWKANKAGPDALSEFLRKHPDPRQT